MDSITNNDIEDKALNAMLVSHLKSEDFFDVKNFPTASFELSQITMKSDAKPGGVNAEVRGALTMKGVTGEVNFPALIEMRKDGALAAEAHFDIDRTRWNVLYGSGKFYEKLGMHLVHDNISLGLKIIAV
jgi:polyisoprenoid-binding protein YceI